MHCRHVNTIYKQMLVSRFLGSLLIDFLKAFDTVDHTILITELRKFYDLSDSVVIWFSDYLQIDSGKSAPQNIKCGVPQSSILGLTLFTLCINDLMLHTNFFEPVLFADDTNLFVRRKISIGHHLKLMKI